MLACHRDGQEGGKEGREGREGRKDIYVEVEIKWRVHDTENLSLV